MTDSISGLWVALVTPLDAMGGIDQSLLTRHAQSLLGRGCDGVVLFGTTGEGTSFSGAERLAATEALLAAGVPAGRIGIGTGFPAIPDAVSLTKSALALGLRHVLLLPPYFYRDVDARGIEDAFAAVLDGVADDRLRATLYHIPQVSGIAVPPRAVASLRARYGGMVAGVKDSSASSPTSRLFAPLPRMSRSRSATRPISAARSPRAAPARSAASPISCPISCAPCSRTRTPPPTCGARSI